MIIDEVCNSKETKYKDYKLTSEELEEIRIASWLHDCGKVITPVHIVDKATKLECIYNRIHEIRMRFELLKSYADRDYWKGMYDGVESSDLENKRNRTKKELDEEFAFVACCNTGGDFMSDEAVQRLGSIAERVWTRTINNTLGLGDIELSSYPESAFNQTLPVEEKLLADKEEHIVKKLNNNEEDDEWNFTLEKPENESNSGELYNLSIRKGTLSPEDRYIISAQTIHTIKMLSALPFPKHLQKIVEIAGSHHEQLNGGGYPRSLKDEQLSIPAKVMSIADVFEALTSCDRPYKKAKTLNEALKIMKFMVNDNHIDRGLFELFVKSGKPQEYARKYLLKEQLDEVNIDELLS